MKLSKTLRRKRQISWKRCYQSPPSKFDSFELYFRKKKERTCPLINLGCPRGPIIAANIAARVGVPQEPFLTEAENRPGTREKLASRNEIAEVDS